MAVACGGAGAPGSYDAPRLPWLTAYWVTGTIGTSFAPYAKQPQPAGRVDVPTVITQFPRDLVRAPRAAAERIFDLRVWQEPAAGGHFAAWERPDDFMGGAGVTASRPVEVHAVRPGADYRRLGGTEESSHRFLDAPPNQPDVDRVGGREADDHPDLHQEPVHR